MLDLNHEDTAHWTDLLDAFGARLSTVSDAADVELLLEQTLTKTRHLLRAKTFDWNKEHSALSRLGAPEVWASCFSFLSLGECIRASHVSRSWRATALAFPHLWSRIELPPMLISPKRRAPSTGTAPMQQNSDRLLQMAISRAGQCPLDIAISLGGEDLSAGDTEDILRRSMHRIRSLSVPDIPLEDLLEEHAPLLEELSFCKAARIPERLFGGTPGRLRSIEARNLLVPYVCPALSTVTSLKADAILEGFGFSDEMLPLSTLFEFMPLLESLSLGAVTSSMIADDPETIAPSHLRRLALNGEGCDLALYASSLRTEFLRDVSITTGIDDFVRSDAHAVFEGAHIMTIDRMPKSRVRVSVFPNGSTGITWTLMLGGSPRGYLGESVIAGTLANYYAQLASLQEISAPAAMLNQFFGARGLGQPSVAFRLQCMRMSMRLSNRANRRTATAIEGLSFLGAFPGSIARIEITVKSSHMSLSRENAVTLVAKIAATVQNRSQVVVKGFPPECAQAVDVGSNDIVFVTS